MKLVEIRKILNLLQLLDGFHQDETDRKTPGVIETSHCPAESKTKHWTFQNLKSS